MAGDSFDYEDVTVYTLESEDEERLLKLQNRCTFIWANRRLAGWCHHVICMGKGCFHGLLFQANGPEYQRCGEITVVLFASLVKVPELDLTKQ